MITKDTLIENLKKEYGHDPELDCVDKVIESIEKSTLPIDMETAIFLYNCKQIDKHIGYS
jgi:hypothetical protein